MPTPSNWCVEKNLAIDGFGEKFIPPRNLVPPIWAVYYEQCP